MNGDSGLGKTRNEILIFENSQCTSEITDYTIKKAKIKNNNDINESKFVIVGKNSENYNGQCSKTNITLTTNQNELLFYLKDNSSNNFNRKEIYNEESHKNIFSIIKSKGIGEYKVEFINLATEKSEFFKMVSDPMFKECHIYYGEELIGAPIVCKIKRKGDSCEVMITPNIDKIFIIGLASFFFCEEIYNNENEKIHNNDYDNVARMTMPNSPKMINKDEYKDKYQNSKYHDITEDIPKKVKNVKRKTLCAGISTALCCCFACEACECCSSDNDDENNNDKNKTENMEAKEEMIDVGLEFVSDYCDCCDICGGDCICTDCGAVDCCGCTIIGNNNNTII